MTPKIYYFTPQGSESWGESINRHCAIVPNPEDWICLVEADVMLFPADWAREVEWAVTAHPEVDVFSAYATRTRTNSEVLYDPDLLQERDMVKLYEAAIDCWHKNRGRIRIRKHSPAGFFYVFRRGLWDEYPFPVRGSRGEMNMRMDIDWGKRLRKNGKVIANIEALLCVHYYRMHDEETKADHLL